MRAFTDATTLSCHFIFLGIDWGKIQAQGRKGTRKKERKRERLRLEEDERKSPQRSKKERAVKIWEVFISLLVDWHIPTGEMELAQIVPQADYHQLCSDFSMPGLMALWCYISSKVSWNICEQYYREGCTHFLLINRTNLRHSILSGTPDLELEDIIQLLL